MCSKLRQGCYCLILVTNHDLSLMTNDLDDALNFSSIRDLWDQTRGTSRQIVFHLLILNLQIQLWAKDYTDDYHRIRQCWHVLSVMIFRHFFASIKLFDSLTFDVAMSEIWVMLEVSCSPWNIPQMKEK